jgi:hypothetical protein
MNIVNNNNCKLCGLINIFNNNYCRFCYMINNYKLKYNYIFKEMTMYISQIEQTDIIKKTNKYIVENMKTPSILEIDKNALQINLSLFEYTNLMNIYDEIKKNKLYKNIMIPDQFKLYKFFITFDFDISHLIFQNNLFECENIISNITNNNIKEVIPSYEMSLIETKFIKIIFETNFESKINNKDINLNNKNNNLNKQCNNLNKQNNYLDEIFFKLNN